MTNEQIIELAKLATSDEAEAWLQLSEIDNRNDLMLVRSTFALMSGEGMRANVNADATQARMREIAQQIGALVIDEGDGMFTAFPLGVTTEQDVLDFKRRKQEQVTRIINAAGLLSELMKLNDGDGDHDAEAGEFHAALKQIQENDDGEWPAVLMAAALIDGQPYTETSDDPKGFRRCMAVAQAMRARVEMLGGDPFLGSSASATFYPPPARPTNARATQPHPVLPPSAKLKLLFEDIKNQAASYFIRDGEMVSRFFLVFDGDGDGDLAEVVCPWNGEAQKRQMMNAIKQRIRERGSLLRYCHVSEVWASADKDVRPSKSPNRTEHLMVIAEERGTLPIGGWFEIKRHALSPMPTLGSWVDASGEMINSSMFDLFDNNDQRQMH